MSNVPTTLKVKSTNGSFGNELSSDPAGLRPVIQFGTAIIALFFLGFGGWASIAPLNSAVIASGKTVVESSRKKIQHFEGGIVGQILVNDGDHVTKGQTLLRLNETQPKSRLDMAKTRLMFAAAVEARLVAEFQQKMFIRYPVWLMNSTSDKTQVIITTQNTLLATRRASNDGQKEILERKIQQFLFEIEGLQGQRKFDNQQIQILDEELADLRILQNKGLARKPRLLKLKRDRAQLSGTLSQLDANVARIKQHIIETELNIVEMDRNHRRDVSAELSNVRSKIMDLKEKIVSAKDVLTRLDIVAPIEGVIMSLNVHTQGGVVSPGETIMEIIPSEDRLIIEARIRPSDIDHLHVGLSTKIRFTALNRKFSKLLDGKVIFISPDGLVAENSGALHYLIRIALAKNSENLPNNQKIIPGMQTEVIIQTGTKTPLTYLMDPLTQSFNRSWREN